MKVSSEISKIIRIGHNLLVLPIDLPQFLDFVKSHLSLRSFQIEGCVPCPTVWQIESAAHRVCVSEGSVNDVRVGYAKYKFMNTDARQQTRFTEQSIVGRTLKLE